MDVQVWDSVFVRASRADVHPLLADPLGYGRWWPEVAAAGSPERITLLVRPPGLLAGRQRWVWTPAGERPDKGIAVGVAGDFTGDAEWFYLDEPAGVVVHYLLRARTGARGSRRRLAGHHAAVRAGLHSLKDRLEGDRLPGTEPDPWLVAQQQAAGEQVDRALF